jgi:tetratricopeptide (TPR) repeat protein
MSKKDVIKDLVEVAFFLLKKLSIPLIIVFVIVSAVKSHNEKKEVERCWCIEKVDLKEAIKYGKSLVDKYPKNIEAYRCLAGSYDDAGYYTEAYNTMKKALEIAENKWSIKYWLESHTGIIGLYEEAGDSLKEIDLDDAIEYYKKGLDEATEEDDARVILFKNDIGYAYYLKGDIDNALKYLRGALYDLDNCSFKHGGINRLEYRIYIYSNLAAAFHKKGDNDLAEEYSQKALSEEKDNIENFEYPTDYFVKLKIGDMCRTLGMYKCAEEHYLDASEIAKKQNNEYREALAYMHLAELYKDAGEKGLAKEYYERAYKLFKLLNADGFAEMMLKKIKEQEQSET